MVTLLLDSERLEVVLSPVERAVAFRRGNIQVAREQIAKVMLTDDAWIWLRGVPSPATTVPSVMAIGTWKTGSGRDFSVIRGRRPSVVIDLEGHEDYERLLVTTRHGLELVRALRLDDDHDTTPSDPDARTPAVRRTSGDVARPARDVPDQQEDQG